MQYTVGMRWMQCTALKQCMQWSVCRHCTVCKQYMLFTASMQCKP